MNSLKLRIIFIIIAIAYIFVVGIAYASDIDNATGMADGTVGKQQTGVENIKMRIYKFEDREMLKLRDLAEKYNWSLGFVQDTKEISISKNNNSVKLSAQKQSDGIKLIDGRSYLTIDALGSVLDRLEEEAGLITGLYTDQQEYIPEETINAHIRVYNFTGELVKLDFSSGQRYDLYLMKNGEEVWRWSDGRFFTMALAQIELETGEKLAYDVEVDTELQTGEYLLSGKVATIKEPIELNELTIIIIGND